MKRTAALPPGSTLKSGSSIHIEEFDAGFAGAHPPNFTVKPQFPAFDFDGDALMPFKTFGVGRNAATTDADVFDHAGAMGRVLLQKAGPLASFTRKDASFFEEFLCRRIQDAVTWKRF
ncbi:MAG: hypothetical protein NXH99_12315 [Rhodobacteraceae bacterium]|nr:hypothetical protein [Paracoccaceae bacterium]